MYLEEIPQIKAALKLAKANKIKLLHQLIFGIDKDRLNRKNLRKFQGFNFDVDSDEFTIKLRDITDTFSYLELIAIVNLMAIEIDGIENDITHCILNSLTCLEIFANSIKIATDSEIEDITHKDPTAPIPGENTNY